MADTSLRISPFCARLRSKKYYFLEQAPQKAEDVLDGSGRCWCTRTMDSVGPDGSLVDPEDCRAKRTCFVPYGVRA